MRKRCILCGKIKPTAKFGVDNRAKDELKTSCRLCNRMRDKKREHVLSRRFSNYKRTARVRSHVFDVTIDEFESITNNSCKYCGGYSDSDHDEQFCGIDRINSNMGYVRGNMVPCCYTCNMMKASLTYDEFVDHIRKIACNLKIV